MKRSLLLIILLVIVFYSSALIPVLRNKVNHIDSLISEIDKIPETPKTYRHKIELIKLLSDEYAPSSPDRSIECLKHASIIAKSNNDMFLFASMINLIGKVYYYQQDYIPALDNYRLSYKLMLESGYKDSVGYILVDIGSIFYAQDIYDLAVVFNKRAERIFNKTENTHGLSVINNNLGLVKWATNQYDSALYFFVKALDYRKKLNNPFLIAHSYNYIGGVYIIKGEFDKAILILDKAIEIGKKSRKLTIDEKTLLPKIYSNKSLIYKQQQLYDKALENSIKALNINLLDINDKILLCKTYLEIVQLFIIKNDFNSALFYALKCLEVSKKIHNKKLRQETYLLLYKIYVKLGNHQEAVKYLEYYSAVSDTLNHNQIDEKLKEIQSSFDTYEKEKEIELKQVEMEKESAVSNHQKIIFIGCLLFLITISLLLTTAYRKQLNANTLLLQSKTEITNQKNEIEEKQIQLINEINERKKIQEKIRESENRYRTIYESSNEAYITLSNEICVDCNPKALKLFRCSRNDLIGKRLSDISAEFQPDNSISGDKIKQIIKNVIFGFPEEFDWIYKKFDGIEFESENSIFRVKYEDKLLLHIIIRDVSLHKINLRKIEILNAELENKTKEMEQLLYVSSHDLRSPLINIQGFSHEIKKSYDNLTNIIREEKEIEDIRNKSAVIINNEIPEFINYISLSVFKMNVLISGLLKLSRLGRLVLNPKVIKMNKLISEVLSFFEYRIKNNKIKITISKLPDCYCDENSVNQVFSNLIDNAIKFSDPQKTLEISISGYKEENDAIYCVSDTGIGIDKKQVKKIFEVFQKLDNKSSGDGLGLSIVSKILDKQNGKIWVESEIGIGSKFYVSLPLTKRIS
jgi:PAS domain S-box-containing protein